MGNWWFMYRFHSNSLDDNRSEKRWEYRLFGGQDLVEVRNHSAKVLMEGFVGTFPM